MKKIYAFILTLIGFSVGFTWAQEKVLDENYFGFESAGAGWTINDAESWTLNNEKVASGNYSIKYSVMENTGVGTSGLYSINTGYTIQKVRTAKRGNKNYIVASTYEGMVMGVSYDGVVLWKNELSGYMNHDLWCEDITGDGNDEVMVANADGTVYCIDNKGTLLWNFRKNEAPMYAVCVVSKDNTPYVVCGGFDLSYYYLSAEGKEVKEVKSSTYSEEKPWGTGVIPPKYVHTINFLRKIKNEGGSETLVVLGTNNHMQVEGTIYQFEPLADEPFLKTKVNDTDVIGDLKVVDPDGDGKQEILLGTSAHQSGLEVVRMNPKDGVQESYDITGFDFGYRVTQTEFIPDGDSFKYLFIAGSNILLVEPDLSSSEKLSCTYSFNDLWKDPDSHKIILASSQSGGSCIHVLDTKNAGWKKAYAELTPPGKIQKILDNTQNVWDNLEAFQRPAWERDQLPVYLMTENTDNGKAKVVADNIRANYSTPVFLGGSYTNKAEDWDRSVMENEKYRDRRDGRRQYVYSQQQCLDLITPWYNNEPGIAYWGGHGNDPYMFHLSTTKKVLDYANGKKTVLIYPELEDHTEDFAWVMDDLFYPLADYAQNKNGNIFVRTKHCFWQANIYLSMWKGLLSGEYADVFVPSMEETTDKSMELSLAGRVGVWASGSVNSWGTRSVPDNPSFDRSRQHSHQTLPNCFLRHMVYHISCGAQYINSFPRNPDYMCLFWELIAKGALYVPKRSEIVSFSPVHLSMTEPDEHYQTESSNVKWTTFWDEEYNKNNPMVFSHLNGSWPAAPVTEWDFSRYAAGVIDRRQNFLPSYSNGMVLITPPQNGVYADKDAPRGALTDNLHPIYKDIMKEYITDGRNYYSADGTQTYRADEYYTTIADDIKNSAKKLPVTVTGDVAWVVAQTSPTHLRLTIIDGGYINPADRKATITFNTVQPKAMKDLLDGETFNVSNPSKVEVDIPCGLFRFIDVELTEAL